VHEVFPDCETGAMPPFGNLYGLPVYVDRHLARERELVFQAGNHREAVRVEYSDFERLVHPTVADLCSHRRP
jgi:Ala-tRNA(Pro) deacylase